MAKRDLASLTTDLGALAMGMPTQRPTPVVVPAAPVPVNAPVALRKDEPLSQFSLSLRRDLRKQLGRLADDADMTMRAFVLNALKEKGLEVRDEDLADLRKAVKR